MRSTIRLLSGTAVACGLLALAPATPRIALAADELKVGDLAPDFTLPGTDGKTYTLSQLRGKNVVLAWFPKAFTGG